MKATDRHKLIDRIKTLDGLTDDERSALLGLLNETKTYGLVWEDKPEMVEERLRTELPMLKEVKSRALISDNADAPNHALIEGDNLEALTTLYYTHEGKIDVIYIDPPYNRGENDFIYNDKFIDRDNPFKHSLWLCFMKKRLAIAKKLLSNTGIIILHIDEHEYHALNTLLETEIFSSQNNLGTIIWNKMNPKGDAKGVATMHEYIIVFAKNKDAFLSLPRAIQREKPNAQSIINKARLLFSKLGKKAVPEEIKSALRPYGFGAKELKQFEVEYTLELINKEFQTWLKNSSFSKGEKAYKFISHDGRVFRTVSMAWPNKDKAPNDYWIPLRHPTLGMVCPLPSKGWRNPPATMRKLLGDESPYDMAGLTIKGEIAFSTKRNGSINIPERVYFLDENMSENVPSIFNDGSSNDSLFEELGITFEYPKTLIVAKYLLKTIHPQGFTILDFFAGSGTTLHAVMQLNAEDGGKRQCILCTNNENGICENVTYERNKRVINGYTKPNGEAVEGLHENNLRYYRTDFVNRRRTPQNMRRLMLLSSDMLCIKENLYTEHDEFGGMETMKNGFRFFSDSKKQMLIVYNEEAIYDIVDALETMDVPSPIIVYVFSPGNDAWNSEFESVSDKVSLTALPAAIYNAYKRILPKPKNILLDPEETPKNEDARAQENLFDFGEGGEA